MTKSIQHIKTELAVLESTVAEAAEELQNSYKNYLELLSRSVNQQLILGSYQICTQFYPQSFLKLSLNQKQEIQQKIRNIGQELQSMLLHSSEDKEIDLQQHELNFVAEMLKNLPVSSDKEDEEDSDRSIDLELIKSKLQKIDILELPITSEIESETEHREPVNFNNPEHLILWHKQIERNIRKNLDAASKNINECLQNMGIIPNRVPTKVIEIAIKGDSSDSGRNTSQVKNLPNILNLVIETDKDKKSKITSAAQISLLRLRLSEIEFSDPLLSGKRNQIRAILSKIGQLRRKYRDKKQEYAIAQAEAAWRSSWYED
ncbi:MAG: hypothetical protein Tsb0014_07780 [Pleurocapsa sp.]